MATQKFSAKCKRPEVKNNAGEVTSPEVIEHISVDYDFGDTIKQAVNAFGDEAVMFCFTKGATQELQAHLRREFLTKDSATIVSEITNWKPEVRQVRQARVPSDPTTDVLANWDTMPEEKKAEFMRKLQERINQSAETTA
jgi:hypothetical protein